KLLVAFFNAATPRTAGFNTTDLFSLSDSGYLLTVVLMFIGGGSGSTAGGVKVGTMAVIVMGMVAAFKGKKDVTIGSRRIDSSVINQALAVFSSCLLIVVFSTVTLCAIEPDEILSFKQLLFEVVSALGTVGLSMSATPLLSSVSKVIVILLMFTGRVGILTFALAFGKTATSDDVKKPVGNILIG
ncbi:MAG TPA: Trk family potassium uptake protein, partial [Clostridiales bacterium]|nr:Trk family potassium uptake protein [Clostridiales bacterium]